MKWKLSYLLAVLIVVALLTISVGSPKVAANGPLDGSIMDEAVLLYRVSNQESIVLCQDKEFSSVGPPVGLSACVTTSDCREHWPAGPSFEMRDRSVCACGLCGEYT